MFCSILHMATHSVLIAYHISSPHLLRVISLHSAISALYGVMFSALYRTVLSVHSLLLLTIRCRATLAMLLLSIFVPLLLSLSTCMLYCCSSPQSHFSTVAKT